MKIINFLKKSFYLFFLLSTQNCQINPATGVNEITLMSEKEEIEIGRNEHSKILDSYGGEYKNKKIKNYINSLGKFLVSTSELPNLKFTFTILDTPIVNAFALPGGYIYITRGLLTICQNEAQIAGVLSHEIGHVTARHAANRYTQAIGTSLLANILNTISNSNLAGNLINQSAGLYILSYSRKQEYEADKLSVRYMRRAGFDPFEMSKFLGIMKKYSKLQNRIVGNEEIKSDLLLTHPSSPKRINKVIKESLNEEIRNPIKGKEIFLKKIDDLNYGEQREEGVINSQGFFHPSLNFFFKLSDKFHFINYPDKIIGIAKDKSKIIFTIDENYRQQTDFLNYLKKWSRSRKIFDVKEFEVNGLKASSALLIVNKKKIRLVIINKGETMYRFLLIPSKNEAFNDHDIEFYKIIKSFKMLSNTIASKITSNKIKIVTVRSNDTIASLLEKQSLQKLYGEKTFKIMNDLDKKLEVGQKVKLIVND